MHRTAGHDHPLPAAPLLGHAGIGGRIKMRSEDFIVEEIPLYEPCGEGEHLYLRIRKKGVSHGELLSRLRMMFGVQERAIGYAGMKDKHAVTTQVVSIHTPHDPDSLDTGHDRIQIIDASRHRNKLKRGHLAGNLFAIRIREIEPIRAPAALRIMRDLERTGIPCTFGGQRFGYRLNNHRLGALFLQQRWEDVLAELLGPGGSPWPEHQKAQREAFAAGDFQTAANLWSPADRSELIAARALARGESPRSAVKQIGATTLGFWTTALSSAAFNHVLTERFAAGTVHALGEGDIAWKHLNRVTFPVDAATAADPETLRRLESREIAPTGPIWGAGMSEALGTVAATEEEALLRHGITPDQMRTCRWVAGARRPIVAPIRDANVESGFDEHGPFVMVRFALSRGLFATAVLQEITGRSETMTEHGAGNPGDRGNSMDRRDDSDEE